MTFFAIVRNIPALVETLGQFILSCMTLPVHGVLTVHGASLGLPNRGLVGFRYM